jgi:hypothetical protein
LGHLERQFLADFQPVTERKKRVLYFDGSGSAVTDLRTDVECRSFRNACRALLYFVCHLLRRQVSCTGCPRSLRSSFSLSPEAAQGLRISSHIVRQELERHKPMQTVSRRVSR